MYILQPSNWILEINPEEIIMTVYEHVCVLETAGTMVVKAEGPSRGPGADGARRVGRSSGNFGFTLGEKRGFSKGEICILDNPLAPGLRTDAGGQV